MTNSKACPHCNTDKPFTDFPKCAARRDGHYCYCKACNNMRAKIWCEANVEQRRATARRIRLKADFGLSVEDYDDILETQGGVCAICQGVCPTGRRLAVDHCHVSGAVRGLLCSTCNHSLGLLRDSPANFAACLVYLAAHGKALTTAELHQFLDAYPTRDTA